MTNFKIPKEKIAGKVTEVVIGATSDQGGTRSHTITIGGSTALPFLLFEGDFFFGPEADTGKKSSGYKPDTRENEDHSC